MSRLDDDFYLRTLLAAERSYEESLENAHLEWARNFKFTPYSKDKSMSDRKSSLDKFRDRIDREYRVKLRRVKVAIVTAEQRQELMREVQDQMVNRFVPGGTSELLFDVQLVTAPDRGALVDLRSVNLEPDDRYTVRTDHVYSMALPFTVIDGDAPSSAWSQVAAFSSRAAAEEHASNLNVAKS